MCSSDCTNPRGTCCENHVYCLLVGLYSARHRGLDLAQVEVHVITAPILRLDRDPDRTRLLETARRLRPRLLLLDPCVRLHGIDENHAGEVADLLAHFRSLHWQLDLSVLLVGGWSRPGGEPLSRAKASQLSGCRKRTGQETSGKDGAPPDGVNGLQG
jgi:RecA-family ATPase